MTTAPDMARSAASLPGTGHRAMRIPMLETNVIREVAATVERDYGRCDVLVNSAGFTRMIPHPDLEALTDDGGVVAEVQPAGDEGQCVGQA